MSRRPKILLIDNIQPEPWIAVRYDLNLAETLFRLGSISTFFRPPPQCKKTWANKRRLRGDYNENATDA